jgi:hypothetical protein
MNSKKIWAGIFAGAALTVLSACLLPVGDGVGLDENDNPIPSVPPDTNLAFVYDNAIAPANCKNCHGASHVSGVTLNSLSATFNSFFNLDSTPRLTNELQTTFPIHRVQPGSLDSSFLWQKIDPNFPVNSLKNGVKMPAPGAGSVLTATHIAIIRAWILRGAPIQ